MIGRGTRGSWRRCDAVRVPRRRGAEPEGTLMVLNWFRKKNQPVPPAADHWTLARTEEEGRLVAFRYRSLVPAGIRTQDYPHLINIYWRFDGGDQGGMPSS